MLTSEKPKGLPRPRGPLMLVLGVVIGAVGVLALMFVLTLPNCACEPMPVTTIPSIPTPVPGVTGTAAAQSVSSYLKAFYVDEAGQQIVLAYILDGRSMLALYAWDGSHVGAQKKSFDDMSGTEQYTRFQILPAQSLLSATAVNGLYLLPLGDGDVRTQASPVLYSPDGIWTASLSGSDLGLAGKDQGSSSSKFIGDMTLQTVVFSHDAKQLAVAGVSSASPAQTMVRLYSVPGLNEMQTFTITAANPSHPDILFTPDDSGVVVRLADSIHMIKISTAEQRFFKTDSSLPGLDMDASGRWLAVAVQPGTSLAQLRVYDVQETDHLLPDGPKVYTLPYDAGFQFVKDGLLVNTGESVLTLYHWTGSAWGDATTVLASGDLK